MSILTNHKIVIVERTINAPLDFVWEAWADSEKVKKWWGPKIFYAPLVNIDFRVGGKYLFCMKSDQGPPSWQKGLYSAGEYKEIVPFEKIVVLDHFADEHGNVVPASYYGMGEDFPGEFKITVTFQALGEGKTRMVLTHEGIPAGEDSENAGLGWNESFDKLEDNLEF